ncbi:MAG: hypothetical protein ACRD9R_05180 [Pyrinomonadaceae bacterium]
MATKKSTAKTGSARGGAKKSAGAAAKATSKKAAKGGAVATELRTDELTPAASDVFEVEYLTEARKFVPRTKIHVRKEIPVPAEGAEVLDFNPSGPLAFDMPQQPLAAMRTRGGGLTAGPALASTDNLTLVRNIQLNSAADSNTASNVGEPSVASNGDVVFYTGNWYAAVSLDGGQTFLYVDPANAFPDPPGMSFCCDQVVQYIRKIDTFVWLLQYTTNQAGENIQRLAFAKTADVRLGRWRTFDITAQSLGLPGTFLDFPDLAVGTNMLYVTMNGYRGSQWHATALVRLPLSGINSGNVTAQRTISTTNFNFRVAQHCATRAFWASHVNTSTLRLFSWDEAAAQPSFRDVAVARWSVGPYTSLTPDNRNWLARADYRMTGATKRINEVWFAWASGSGGVNNRPNPFVQIARINTTNFSVIDNINLWDSIAGTCYAALSTNSRNEVGVSYMIGGGGINGRFPTHVVGILTGTRREVTTFAGTRGPADRKWGDYLTVRRHYPNTRLFSATGYTLQGGTGAADATPHYTLFGRSGDVIGNE